MPECRSAKVGIGLIAVCLLALAPPCRAAAPEVHWTQGPTEVELGDHLAKIALPEGYGFANGDDARKILEAGGNPPSGQELGLIAPMAKGEDWFLLFEYSAVGYVKDDEKDKIDAEAILKSIREGTEEANKVRTEKGWETLNIVGWSEPPHYDATTHNLEWAVTANSSKGGQSVNYNVRLLGRSGYTSVVLVTDPKSLAQDRAQFAALLGGFQYQQGKRYAEFVSGDKVAEFGLAALVAGGAGAAAVKLGLFGTLFKLLAKAWKLVAVAIAGMVGAVKKMLGLRSKEETEQAPIEP